jgi:hypothetical protein
MEYSKLWKSKSEVEINFINTSEELDIIAIQEVVAGYGGAQAVAKSGRWIESKKEVNGM